MPRQREELEQLNIQLATMNEKLRELEDVRAQFTLLVTHELRAPVAAIQSYLKLILEGYVPQAKVRETLEKAEKRAMEQLALIADLLELGRIGSADARGQVQPVQVEKSLREQADLLVPARVSAASPSTWISAPTCRRCSPTPTRSEASGTT